jgi:hypothetical protein
MTDSSTDWRRALQAYVCVAAAGNLVWETLQLPLYTIWTAGSAGEIVFAVLHCTGGDVLIAVATLTIALVLFGSREWPTGGHLGVLLATLVLGISYTIFSEWLNVIVRKSWAYSPFMPVVPLLNVGLSPVLQWIVVPLAAMSAARRLGAQNPRNGSPGDPPSLACRGGPISEHTA